MLAAPPHCPDQVLQECGCRHCRPEIRIKYEYIVDKAMCRVCKIVRRELSERKCLSTLIFLVDLPSKALFSPLYTSVHALIMYEHVKDSLNVMHLIASSLTRNARLAILANELLSWQIPNSSSHACINQPYQLKLNDLGCGLYQCSSPILLYLC